MDDAQQNESNTLVAWIVGFAAALAIAVALISAFMAAFSGGSAGPVASIAGASAGATAEQPPVALVEVDQPPPLATGEGVPETVRFHFEVGSAALPADAAAQAGALVAFLKDSPEGRLGISGFHDKTGDPAANRELAKNRALATRTMLVEAGAPASRLILVRPQEVEGGADDREARRVEVFPSR
ncbi:OmpA family protein [Quisquiliibacterium transsilvanicum]|jgi:outer membrane protein OmpA-like peptidoglycan-associated protein|uniref:Outer membrane protein OmpA-like peptidoglycan-associated protein n=1 Tax=Quisquiliibacterium transsilvanicum TaxID=1549638 RepID=A0A7W8HIB4_9BURK|nr:OmpA family protein [Quisquiliibacterium transsilvanicum]MBB5272448.1 outer membrane protein OmpA-like peptidoglycan-associated protein [Quisquiliibacterium transsilvanicum]